ncbi:crotonase/enoyl-CoA hydratase family protein [Nocardioides speluncae]|uniref:crotonase/enoyl-CoA hydratase family protein n=1 Tax=Nocardioides speluncae TaxID=2670337 RepID=UPI000D693D3E|nr:crotonase/enoyl-CoA hydratase family protein [Nocardioides speluncae]
MTHVTCAVENGVAQVRLDRPDKLNALTLEVLRDLARTAHSLSKDRSLRAVVLAGEGDSFCAGLDFGSVLKQPAGILRTFTPVPGRGTNGFQEACWAWRRVPVPVIAVVHGHCFGGGLQLAMAADFRFTTPDAQWSVMESKWGLIPDMSGLQTLSEQVRLDVVKRLMMTGETVSGTEAEALGLATGVSDQPFKDADELVARLQERSPDALAAAKRLALDTWGASPRRTFRRERAEQVRLLRLPNTAVARAAAFGKSVADFRPRSR